MLNQVVIVGRICKEPELVEKEGVKVANITLAVPRTYKNVDGEYETDYLPCVLWKGVAETTTEYCKKGDLVGIKGRVESTVEDDKTNICIIAERVTFLSSKKSED